ncbi:MAG TPA: hypothetical protein VLD16_16665 [Gaiellaceae bacterium]|nr:hypothetical protein [Gaiellaceae bacterium]
MSRRLGVLLVIGAVAAGVVASTARADGLPVLGIDDGSSGVTVPTSPYRYVTLATKADTIVARVQRRGGRIVGSRLLPGHYTVPAVAYDGSAGGLSADGRELVLIEPRVSFPRRETTFAVLSARGLVLQRLVRLRGDFSFDAVSPSGGRLYLIQYTSPTDPTRYAVRAFDVRAGRLLREPIVDPRDREQMHGQPVSRATSPDGRWAYTLYDGGGKAPFLHALNTARGTARCIDLDALAGNRYLWRLRLAVTGGSVVIRDGDEPELAVDRASFAVTIPVSAESSGEATPVWGWVLGATASTVLLTGAGLLLVRRRPALG